MRRVILPILVVIATAAAAQGSGLKAGLWEISQLRQTMDGRDMTAQMAAAQERMQQAMANMPPEQRKQMEAMMAQRGAAAGGAGASHRICVSPAMAARDKPIVDPQGRCEPSKVSRSGDKTSFEFNCTGPEGRHMSGKGESTVASGTVSNRIDMTMTDARGSHTMHSETQMKYLGADCQGLKPLDELAGEAKGPGGAK